MRRLRFLVPFCAVLTFLAACGPGPGDGPATPDEPLKVAFVYVGPVGDAGWTARHDAGRKQLEQELGDKVQTTYVENVPEGAESRRVFEDLARRGNKLIFGTSFGYMDPMLAAAKRYPATVFLHNTGFKTAANVGTYFGAAEEGRYLTGMVAAAASKTGKLGYIAAFPIPEVIRGINAFTLGARSVNPKATVKVIWSSTWFGPAIEKQAAESLLDAGSDVLAQHQDSPAAGQAAEARGAKWIGYNDDMQRFAPRAWLTGVMWNWGPYYTKTAEAVMNGTWKSEQYYGHMADGLVTLAPFGPDVPPDVQQRVEKVRDEIVAGTFQPFTGPIADQRGQIRIAEGRAATLEELLAMDYFFGGVLGEIRK